MIWELLRVWINLDDDVIKGSLITHAEPNWPRYRSRSPPWPARPAAEIKASRHDQNGPGSQPAGRCSASWVCIFLGLIGSFAPKEFRRISRFSCWPFYWLAGRLERGSRTAYPTDERHHVISGIILLGRDVADHGQEFNWINILAIVAVLVSSITLGRFMGAHKYSKCF